MSIPGLAYRFTGAQVETLVRTVEDVHRLAYARQREFVDGFVAAHGPDSSGQGRGLLVWRPRLGPARVRGVARRVGWEQDAPTVDDDRTPVRSGLHRQVAEPTPRGWRVADAGTALVPDMRTRAGKEAAAVLEELTDVDVPGLLHTQLGVPMMVSDADLPTIVGYPDYHPDVPAGLLYLTWSRLSFAAEVERELHRNGRPGVAWERVRASAFCAWLEAQHETAAAGGTPL